MTTTNDSAWNDRPEPGRDPATDAARLKVLRIIDAAMAAAGYQTIGDRDHEASKLALLETLAEREGARIRSREVDLAVAPNCQPDILSNPPRVLTIDGAQYVQLKGIDGWEMDAEVHGSAHGYPVLEVTRMAAHGGLVLVATPDQVFLMTAQDFDNPAE